MIKSVKLSALCKMQSGGTPSRSNLDYYEGDFPWAKISDLEKSDDGYIYKTEEHITQEALQSINNRQFQPGTLLLAMYGSVGKTAITKIHLTTNQAILGINIIDDTVLDIKYLKYWFSTIKERLLNRAVGAALPNISLGIVKDLEIPLPPLPQQQKIANIMDAADALRQNDKALIAKYDELTQALFLDMFGDPVSNPKGWEMMKLEGFCEFENGDRSSNYPSGDDIKSSGKLFLSSGDIKKGRFIVKDSKFISQEKYSSLKRGKCYRNDVLMTLRGNGTGKSAIFDCEYEEGFINAQMVIIRPNNKCDPNYLVLQLNNPVVFKRLISFNSGSAQPQLSAQSVKEFKVFVPPVDLQNQFAERVAVIEEQKAIAQKSLVKSEELFNSLLQKAFKGELV